MSAPQGLNRLPLFKRPLSTTPSSTDADRVIDIEARRIADGLIHSALLNVKPAQLNEILELYQTRNFLGWDGYDAKPITKSSKEIAELIIERLPLEVAQPEFVPTPSGGYSIEWRADTKYLSIDIENSEVSCVLIDLGKRKKKTCLIENYIGEYEDFTKWVREEFPING